MVPAGTPTEDTIEHLRPFLESGDTIIDGGNSFYKMTCAVAIQSKNKGFTTLMPERVAVSVGIERGYCQMIGGEGAESAWNRSLRLWRPARATSRLRRDEKTFRPWQKRGFFIAALRVPVKSLK